MTQLLEAIASKWYKRVSATEAQLQQLEREAGVRLPEDYRQFLLWSNGGEGQLRFSYLSLWPVEELLQLNADYGVKHYLPGIFIIGSDSGSKAYGLDYRHNASAPSLISVPFGDLDPSSVTVLGTSFREGIEHLNQER